MTEDQIIAAMREAGFNSKALGILTYEKSAPLIPQAPCDVPISAVKKFVEIIEKKAIEQASQPRVIEDLSHTITINDGLDD